MTPSADILAARIVAIATDFVGMMEKRENAWWDDPSTPFPDAVKNDWLQRWMSQVSGWEPGAPYCAAFDGAVIANALAQVGADHKNFLKYWSAHVMTNARKMAALHYLSALPTVGAAWLARHGNSDRGHAGIVIAVLDNGRMLTVEGNTSSGPTTPDRDRQGDGIFLRESPVVGRGALQTRGFVSAESLLALSRLRWPG